MNEELMRTVSSLGRCLRGSDGGDSRSNDVYWRGNTADRHNSKSTVH